MAINMIIFLIRENSKFLFKNMPTMNRTIFQTMLKLFIIE